VNRRTPQPISSTGIPQVRATSPGAEIRAAQRRAAELKEAEEKRKRAIDKPIPQSSSTSTALTKSPSDAGQDGSNPVSGSESSTAATPSSRAASVRRFQISRTSSPVAALGLRSASGIQKRRAEGSPGVAVLVEQLQRTQHSRKASMVADLVGQQANFNEKQDIAANELAKELSSTPVKPRKRPVVNQAEKKWREERKTAVSAAKQHLLSETLEKSAKAHSSQSWDEESERLAREFEKVALELENDMELDSHDEVDVRSGPSPVPGSVTSPARQPKVQASRTDYSQFASPTASSMKYQPRLPKEPRATASRPEEPAQNEVDDQAVDENDEDYVYDVYIRRPLAETDILTNPLAELESDQQMKDLEASRAGVGIIVITAEDEEYWENFIEDDEEEWDSEDADSNGKLDITLWHSLYSRLLANLLPFQPRIILPTTTRTRNSRHQMRMMIPLPFTGNTEAMAYLTTKSLISMTLAVRMVPATALLLAIDNAMVYTWIPTRKAIDWRSNQKRSRLVKVPPKASCIAQLVGCARGWLGCDGVQRAAI